MDDDNSLDSVIRSTPSMSSMMLADVRPTGPALGTTLLAQRRARGKDLWTGDPLEGESARQWLRNRFGVCENLKWAKEVRAIVDANSFDVVIRLTDGTTKRIPLPIEIEEGVVNDS